MEITEVKVFPIDEEKLRAFVSIVIDRCFMVNDIKVINGRDGLFISMPSRRKKNGDFKDIAHPLNNETRRGLEDRILAEYAEVTGEQVVRRARAGCAKAEKEVPPAPPSAVAVGGPSIGGEALENVEQKHLSDSFWTVR